MSLSSSVTHSFDHKTSQNNTNRFPGILITLEGELPPELANTQVPLQISLSLPEPYHSFLQPVVNQFSDSSTSSLIQGAEDDEMKTTIALDAAEFSSPHDSQAPSQVPDPPCLVLSPTFNCHTFNSWIVLYESIGQWMGNFRAHRNLSEDWEWGREVYWMAFTVAFPNFPSGDWSNWDPMYDLDGPYVQEWLGCEREEESEEGTSGHSGEETRGKIWQQFCQH
ncbi:protein kinase, partial [Marasmius tenuissimus]